MERHKCKLCTKSFSSGRALGGHMRFHFASLPIPSKTQQHQQQQLSNRTESTSSLSFSSEEEERESAEKVWGYGLRENPKKSFRLVDPEFLDAGSVVQDSESETESFWNPTRKRSKRTRKMVQEQKQPKLRKPSSTESVTELELVSSVSDTSPDEDVAVSLMMLSRDVWSSDESEDPKLSQGRGKVFGSGNKKVKNNCFEGESEVSEEPRKVHGCPFCGKGFGSGQALGGHKRSHFLGSKTNASNASKFGDNLLSKDFAKFGENLIDLNLPAPMEDEDFLPTSDEFINPIKH